MLPNFVVIGAMKAGTTSVYHQLRQHPQVFMPETKEPNFFTAEHNWGLGVEWYERLFDAAGDAVARGEASVSYTLYPNFGDVPRRIHQVIPDVRLIYLVRHPVDRAISHLWMDMRQGNPVSDPEQALLERPRFVNMSRYNMQIEQYLEFFPREQMLVVKSEDLRSDRARTLERILAFIGVDPALMPLEVASEWNRGDQERSRRGIDRTVRRVPAYRALANASPDALRRLKRRVMAKETAARPVISRATRVELEDRVRDDVRRLHTHMAPSFDGWGIA
jgi:hypothetical protein